MNSSWVINNSLEGNTTAFGNAFLRGLNADKLLSGNSSLCLNNWIWFYYHELPTYEIKYYYGAFDDILFNTTKLISNMTYDLMLCTDVLQDTRNYIVGQVAQFTTPSAYGLAAFQHVVANIINLSMIYQNILVDTTNTTLN